MPNIFLYAVQFSEAYQRVERFLCTSVLNARLFILPPGSEFTSPLVLHMRSNDILLLFARDDEDIDALLTLRDEYESFRVILILENNRLLSTTRYTQLSPRFICSFDDDHEELGEFLDYLVNKQALPTFTS